MALLSKRTPALLIPVQPGVEPPFGYVRDFYSEMKARPKFGSYYDISSDFCELDEVNGIKAVYDSIGKSPPIRPLEGATLAQLTNLGGGGADCSVAGSGPNCIYSNGVSYAGLSGYTLAVVFSQVRSLLTVEKSVCSLGTNTANIYLGTNGNVTSYLGGSVKGYLDGQPEWAISYKSAGDAKMTTELGSNATTPSMPTLSTLKVGIDGTNLTAATGFRGIIHALVVLTDKPDAEDMLLLTDWATSLTAPR